MKLSQFTSGKWVQQYQYKSFEPCFIHHEWEIDNKEVVFLLSQADKKLGELNAFSELIPDVDFFIQMHVVREGVYSSKIEGTQTNIEEAVQKIENINPDKRNDWQEVQNYIQAMNFAIKKLNVLPLSNRLIRDTHAILLQGVRGASKQPGAFRKSQNWIGGSAIADAVFIPPYHENIDVLMNDIETFIHDENLYVPHLIKIAIIHYQFETIHPFLDGNGRMGRLLIVLYLVSNGLLSKPTLYLSHFFEKYRTLYYNHLQDVRINSNLIPWIKFFLQGVITTSENGIQTFREIIQLNKETDEILLTFGKKQTQAKKLIQYLYASPVVDIDNVSQILTVSYATAKRLVDDMISKGILKEITGYKRNRQFIFEKYLSLFK